MRKRETDTSASESERDGPRTVTDAPKSDAPESDATTDASEDAEADAPEAEALFDVLVEGDVLTVTENERVRTTDAFDDTHAIYHDSYVGVDDPEFHEAVAVTFGLPDEDSAARLVAERGVTRDEFVCYLAVRSHLDRELSPDDLGELSPEDFTAMAGMVSEAVPDSPVPSAVADVTDDPEGFLAGRDRAVVSVWKRFCDPCETLEADLAEVLSAVPDDVAVAGVDGEVATGFCETHAVASVPGFVLFRDEEEPRTVTGGDPDAVVETLRSAYPE